MVGNTVEAQQSSTQKQAKNSLSMQVRAVTASMPAAMRLPSTTKRRLSLKILCSTSAGIRVYGYGGNPTVNNEGNIKTVGGSAKGIEVDTQYYYSGSEAPKATINHDAGTITTSGSNASGLYINSSGADGTYDITSSGNINTSGSGAHGIEVKVLTESTTGSPGTANVTINGGAVSATGYAAAGILTNLRLGSSDQGDSNVTINGGSVSGGWGGSFQSAGVRVLTRQQPHYHRIRC